MAVVLTCRRGRDPKSSSSTNFSNETKVRGFTPIRGLPYFRVTKTFEKKRGENNKFPVGLPWFVGFGSPKCERAMELLVFFFPPQ